MITEKRIDEIYADLDKYIIDLLDDPKSLGPTYLQERMATCRNHLNRVSLFFSELSREKTLASADLRAYEDAFKLEYDELLATDEHIKRLSNIEDRKSTVAHTLRNTQRQINETKRQVTMLEAILKVVVHRQRELHSTMDILKEQRRLMDSEIKSGAMYGDERPNVGRGPGGGVEDDISAADLDALLQPLPLTSEELEEAVEPVVEEPEVPPDVAADVPERLPEPIAEPVLEAAPAVVVEVPTKSVPVDQDEAAIQRFFEAGKTASVDTKTPKNTVNSAEDDDILGFLDSI